MDLPHETIETTIKVYLRQMRERLDEAAGIAKAVIRRGVWTPIGELTY